MRGRIGTDPSTPVNPREVARKLRFEYNQISLKQEAKILDHIRSVLNYLQKTGFKLDIFLHEIAQLLYREFNIKELSIGVKSARDGLYRYAAYAGMRPTAIEAFKRLEYSKEEFLDPKKYPGAMISRSTKLFLAEDNPYVEGEEETYNRPLMLSQRRKSIDDTVEGDYLDIFATDSKNEVIGWIEISGTKKGKLPDAMTIRWLETIAAAIGVAILVDQLRRSPRRIISGRTD